MTNRIRPPRSRNWVSTIFTLLEWDQRAIDSWSSSGEFITNKRLFSSRTRLHARSLKKVQKVSQEVYHKIWSEGKTHFQVWTGEWIRKPIVEKSSWSSILWLSLLWEFGVSSLPESPPAWLQAIRSPIPISCNKVVLLRYLPSSPTEREKQLSISISQLWLVSSLKLGRLSEVCHVPEWKCEVLQAIRKLWLCRGEDNC